MEKVYKEYCKAQGGVQSNFEPLDDLMSPPGNMNQNKKQKDRNLTQTEKKYLLATERGDINRVKYLLEQTDHKEEFDKNAVDPLGRNSLHIAIEYENLEMMELLLNNNVESYEAILHAINEEFVEAVEMLLNYQDSGFQNNSETFDQNDYDPEKPIKQNDNKLFNAAREALLDEANEKTNSDSKWSFLVNALMKNRAYNKRVKKRQLRKKPQKCNSEANLNDSSSKSFTPDITPLVLAAHKDNYEIIKILLDRGEQIMEPHDVRCSCSECLQSRSKDSLRYSKSRINAYKALSSPSLISLSSKDPILTAFQLSMELKRLSRIENEFKTEYEKLSLQCQEYASALLNETRTSEELEIILNHDHENPPALFENEKEKACLSRLKLAIKCKQKKFVAHPHCQQLLVSLWYDGISSYRRRNIVVKFIAIILICLIFPLLSLIYLILPYSKLGKILRQPFIKFICHQASYIVFLGLLILVSVRIESSVSEEDKETKEIRGPLPTSVEWCIYLYVASFIWSEIKQLYGSGFIEYVNDWWNLLDFTTNSLYITTIGLKLISYWIVHDEKNIGNEATWYRREKWDPWDPTLIGEGIFAIANIFSSLKLVFIFTINPHLGPLQISLGRMIFDIMKFSVFILLVLFAFTCGLNQLLWYYASMRNNLCKSMTFDTVEEKEECFAKGRYFEDLFCTLQTMYWGVFGYVEKDRIETLFKPHTFTMFVGLLMFGTYIFIIIIVILNLLIAMMNNSYQIIANQADEEWKFARSKLWLSYFEEGSTLPAPFNLVPSPKSLFYLSQWLYQNLFCLKKSKRKQARWLSIRKVMKKISEREYRYHVVIKDLVKRYIMRKQQRDLNTGVTEDDLNEIKQDIASFRYELLEIFKNNAFKVAVLKQAHTKRKRGKLNLEKAMSKNMFEDSKNQSMNIFENFKNIGFADQELLKKSYQQSVINASLEASRNKTLAADQSLHHESETKPKTNKVQITEPDIETPSMFKIALKIKRLTEDKILKKTSSVDSKVSSVSSVQELKPCIKKTPNDEINYVLTEENQFSEDVVEIECDTGLNAKNTDEAPKASPDHTTEVELELKSQSEVDAFTERITEV